MKITSVRALHSGKAVYVKVETDVGIDGFGEATNFTPRAVVGMVEEVAPYLVGEDPRRIEHLWQETFRRLFARGGPVTGSAVAGIDIALWDIKGKFLDTPVYELLGGLARDKVRLYSHVKGYTAEEIAANARDLVQRGVTAIRYRGFHDSDEIGVHDHQRAVDQQVAYTAAIREAVGDDVELIVECHGRYDPPFAIQLAQRLQDLHPLYIEDPIRHENPAALAHVRDHSPVPLATGERAHSKWDFRELVTDGLVQYLRPDICWSGGFTEMRKIAALAEVYYLNLVPHNTQGVIGTAASLHASLALSNVTLLEAPWAGHEREAAGLGPWPRVEDGYAFPIPGAGLGVYVEEGALPERLNARRSVPILRGRDGSVRDW
ncbi:MAG: galactonate dehydratase [Nocardioidaceae bacterium]